MKDEIWKKIKYSAEYEISNYGRIRHLFENRYDINTKKIIKISKIKYLKPVKRGGYERIRIYKDKNNFKSYSIHKLVAEAFVENPNNYKTVDHIDRNRSNNYFKNLRWVTSSENSINKSLKNNKKILQYDKNNNLINIWDNISQIYKKTKICYKCIENCCKGFQKTSGGFIWKYED